MRTSAAALELDFTEPSITAAKAVADTIARNGSLQRSTLLWVMEQAYGGSSADGRWSLRDAYDMLELAEVMLPREGRPSRRSRRLPRRAHRAGRQSADPHGSQRRADRAPAILDTGADRLPRRARCAHRAHGPGARALCRHRPPRCVRAPAPARASSSTRSIRLAPRCSRPPSPGVAVTRHDAELIHDLLAPSIRPTAVLINPPFSRSIGRHADPLLPSGIFGLR